jgi:tetratricopeptide (TPR) repeat protein
MIFISYRRTDSEDLAIRLADKLREHFGADAVFLDRNDIELGDNWRETIEVSLLAAKAVLAIIGPRWLLETDEYGHRRIDGEDDVLAYELSVALRRGIVTIPLYVHGARPLPERAFPDKLKPLAQRECVEFDILRDLGTLIHRIDRIPGAQPTDRTFYRELLKPLDFDAEINRHSASFTGRQWVEDNLDRWLDQDRASRVFCLLGGPGIGKSAIACHWRESRRDIIAFHQCVSGYAEKTDTKRILLSLAAQIAAASPAYVDRICQIGATELRDLVNRSDTRAVFDNLLMKPLRGDFPAPDQDRLVVIDALDEASRAQGNELARFLGEVWLGMPEWLRLVVTSRPEMDVIRHLDSLHPFILDASSQQNLQDIRSFLVRELAPENAGTETIDQIVQKSEGMFLYARLVVDEVRIRRLSVTDIASFPEGLAGFYDRWFARKFPDVQAYHRDFHTLVSTIIAQKAPLPLGVICSALGTSTYDVRQKLEQLGTLFPLCTERHGGRDITVVTLMHKSLHDWLTDFDRRTHLLLAGSFAGEPELGNRLLAEEAWKVFSRGQISQDAYFRQTILMHISDAGQTERLVTLLFDPGLLESFWPNEFRHEWQRQVNALSTTMSLAQLVEQWLTIHGSAATAALSDAVAASRLSELFLEIGAFDQVVALALAALGTWQAKGIHDSPDMIGCLLALGRVQSIREELDSAARSYERALDIAKQAYPKDSLKMADVLYDLCVFYTQGKRDYKKASECVEECLDIRSRHNPPDLLGMANCINDRAIILSAEGVCGDYLGIYKQALSLLERARPNGHPEMVSTLGNLATELFREQQLDDAIAHLRRANEMAERCLLPQHGYNDFVRVALSQALISNGAYDAGMAEIRNHVTRLEQFPGPDHNQTVVARIKYCRLLLETAHLAGSARLAACFDEFRNQCARIRRAEPRQVQELLLLAEAARQAAEPSLRDVALDTALRACRAFAGAPAKNESERVSATCFQTVLELLVSGPSIADVSPEILAVWDAVSREVQHEADCLPRTRKLLVGLIAWHGCVRLAEHHDTEAARNAFELISRVGSESPDTLDHLESLTETLHHGHHEEICEDLCRRLVDKSVGILGPEHVQTLGYVGNLAHLKLHLKKLEEAEGLLRQSLGRQLAARGGCERRDCLSSLDSLTACLLLNNRPDDARSLVREHVALLPASDAFTSARREFARRLTSTGVQIQMEFERFDAARVCHELSIEIDPASPSTFTNMADLLVAEGDFAGAEPLYRKSMETNKRLRGAEHPLTLQCMSALASVLRLLGDAKAAVPLYRWVYEARNERLGAEHPNTVSSMLELTDVLDASGNTEEARKMRLGRIALLAGKPDLAPLELRTLALDSYQVGDYAVARTLLERAVAVGFELATNHCHLARIALLLDDWPAAQEHAGLASSHLADAAVYVAPRVLWLQLATAVLTGDTSGSTHVLGQLKAKLNSTVVNQWAMTPVLDHIRLRISPEWYALLSALVDAISVPNKVAALDQFPAWRQIVL